MQCNQIVKLALAIAKAPGMTAYGGQMLTIVLDDLAKIRNLEINRVSTVLTALPGTFGPYPLPGDYNRTYDIFYQIPAAGGGTSSSVPIMLESATLEYFDTLFKSSAVSNYPYLWANDTSTDQQTWSGGSPGQGTLTSAGGTFIYPQVSGPINLTHRYFKNQPTIANPETSTQVPWFAYPDYLIDAVAARMMGITGDDRMGAYQASADKKLAPYLIQQGSEQRAVHHVQLDPIHFHNRQNLKPIKQYPF